MTSFPPPHVPTSESDREPDRLERALRSDSLLPLPVGLVSRVLARIADEPLPASAESDAGPFARSPVHRPRPLRIVAMATAALLALGAGIGGLWSVTTGDGIGSVLGTKDGSTSERGTVTAITDLAAAARASTSASVRSLTAVPDQVPGSPAALGAGSLVLLGAAVVGSRRRPTGRGSERATGPSSDADTIDDGRPT